MELAAGFDPCGTLSARARRSDQREALASGEGLSSFSGKERVTVGLTGRSFSKRPRSGLRG